MRGDAAIWRACVDGPPDWVELAGEVGTTPDGAMGRAVEIGAWWLRCVGREGLERGFRAMREGRSPDAVAREMGADVHAALVLAGMMATYGR